LARGFVEAAGDTRACDARARTFLHRTHVEKAQNVDAVPQTPPPLLQELLSKSCRSAKGRLSHRRALIRTTKGTQGSETPISNLKLGDRSSLSGVSLVGSPQG